MKKTIFFLFVVGFFVNAYSQEPLWSDNYSADIQFSITNYLTTAPKVFSENENVFKVVGRTNTPTGEGLAVIKYDISGDIISEQIFADDNHTIIDYKFDDLDYLYIVSVKTAYDYVQKTVIRKYDLNGNLIWIDEIQDIGDYTYSPHSLSISENNTILITVFRFFLDINDHGYHANATFHLYAYNTNGTQLWERIFNPQNDLLGEGIIDYLVHDNEIYLIGSGNGKKLIKVDTDNNMTLNVVTDLPYDGVSRFYLTQDNNFLIADQFKYKLSKMDLDGNILWTQNDPFSENVSSGRIKAFYQDEDENIYISGDFQGKLLTLKLDNDGNLLWYNVVHGAYARENSIILNNGYIYIGGSKSGYLLLKINAETGDLSSSYNYLGGFYDQVTSFKIFDDNKVAVTGLKRDSPTEYQFEYDWITQLLSESSFSIDSPNYSQTINLYPNPLDENQVLSIEAEHLTSFAVYSLTGQMLQQGKFGEGSFHTIQLQNLTKGVYLLKLNNHKQSLTKKIVIR